MTVITTTGGRLEGVSAEGVTRFLGVPFAAPPTGEARFRPPRPPQPWTGVRTADTFGHSAPQTSDLLDRVLGLGDLPRSEDCLTLNVWTPACDDRHRPVLVWVHGGAFVTGSGATPWYDGSRLARRGDVVVVTLNYRLGALGFLHLADLAGEDWAGSGNLGLLDMIAALAWVRDNIGAAGGDPDNVTVFGESAGGCAVAALLAAPAARGLFARAIAQSPSLTQLRTRTHATEMAERFLGAVGLDAGRAERLRDLPVDDLLAAQHHLAAELGREVFTAFAPTPDGTVLPCPVDEALRAGAAGGRPVLVGTTADEMQLFTFADPSFASLDRSGVVERARPWLGDRADAAVAHYERLLPGATPGQVAAAMATDVGFLAPAVGLARDLVAAGGTVYRYLFSWRSPAFGGVLGACHGLELPFVFDNLHAPGVEFFTGAGADRQLLADAMSSAWVHFARTGAPSSDGAWAPWDPVGRTTMVFDLPAGGVARDPDGERLRWWAG